MERDGDSSPTTFFFQPPLYHPNRRRSPSPLFDPVILIILLPILALVFIIFFIFFIFPLINSISHSFTSQILRPNSVKSSWDLLNIFLVLFAILCGFLARRNDNDFVARSEQIGNQTAVPQNHRMVLMSSSDSTGYSDRKVYSPPEVQSSAGGRGSVSGLRRSSSSYPDLRQESWESEDNRLRFYDTSGVNLNSSPSIRRDEVEMERDRVYRSPILSGYTDFDEGSQRREAYDAPVVSSSVVRGGSRRHEVEAGDLLDSSRRTDLDREIISNSRIPSAPSVESDSLRRRKVEAANLLDGSRPREWNRESVSNSSVPSASSSAQDDLQRRRVESRHVRDGSRRSSVKRKHYSEVKEIPVDTFEIRPPSPPPSQSRTPPPSPPPPLQPGIISKEKQIFRSVGRKDKVQSEPEIVQVPGSPAPPSPPPPPPLASAKPRCHHKHKKLDRKVSDATKEIATALQSFYNQSKRKTRNIYENAINSQPSSNSSPEQITQQQPPPPPPPPPPQSRFHNMFKKGNKHKRIHSVPAPVPPAPPLPPLPPNSIFINLFKTGSKSNRFQPSSAPPPPPPPPPSSILNNIFKSNSKSKRFNNSSTISPPPPPPPPPQKNYLVETPSPPSRKSEPIHRRPASTGKPPLPNKVNYYYDREEYLQSGSQSPLIPIPPPLPPFKMPAMRFESRGDFVRIRSTHSSICSSPDREDVDLLSVTESTETMDGGDPVGPISYPPSPDVNIKADTFISRLKDEWRLERMNSFNEKTRLQHPSFNGR